MGRIKNSGPLKASYIQKLRDEGANIGFCSWQDLESELKELLWFEEVHAPMFVELGLGMAESRLNSLGGGAYSFYHSSLR